jgi:hypothetical protein
MAQQRSTGIAAVDSDIRAPLFDGLAPPDVDAVVAAATKRRYPAGSVIVNQGDPARASVPAYQGPCQIFFCYGRGPKVAFPLARAGSLIRRKSDIVYTVPLYREH